MEIKKITVFANTDNPNVRATSQEMKKYFSSLGKSVSVISLSGTSADYEIKAPEADFAISLGGDGTVLTCAVILENTEIPLMAVNKGSFGYITEVSVTEYKEVFKDFEEGKAKLQKRLMLSAEIVRGGKVIKEYSALNDIVVSASSRAKLAHLNLSINHTLASTLKADGIVVASPTGSTAYSLSAGGPVLEPNLSGIVINPISPFSMSVRPLIVSDDAEIEIAIPIQKADIIITADGHNVFELVQDDVVVIKKHLSDAVFVENRRRNFIEVLRDKLGWAGGLNA